MGKQGKKVKAPPAGAPLPRASPGGPPAEAGDVGFGVSSSRPAAEESGLVVRWQKNSAPYMGILVFVATLLAVIQMISLGLPKLLSHWAWLIFTVFVLSVVGCRANTFFTGSLRAEEASAWIIFWAMFMVHGLVWLNCVLVAWHGVLPSSLWHAFGEHGGSHLRFGNILPSVMLLLLPPLLLLSFMIYERKYLVLIYYDFFYAIGGKFTNVAFQIVSPLLPFGLWLALLRPSLFGDLPVWPGLPAALGVCAVANGPPLYYILQSIQNIHGPAAWLPDGGCATIMLPPSAFRARPAQAQGAGQAEAPPSSRARAGGGAAAQPPIDEARPWYDQ